MPRQVVLLSGPIASGKTTLAEALEVKHGFRRFKTRELIQCMREVKTERRALQHAGEALDRRTKGEWIAEALAKVVQNLPDDCLVVVDSVRIKPQIDAVRRAFGVHVIHIHLTASDEELQRRYEDRERSIEELNSYAEARANRTERLVSRLAAVADIVVDTERSTNDGVLVRVASRLGFYGRSVDRLVDVLVGGQYGSEGKGHVASYLAPEYDILVRAGGPNAGHTVFEEPQPYPHHQLPSGTRVSEAKLVIAPGAVLAVDKLLKEIAECEVGTDRLIIDPRAMIIDPEDVAFEKEGSLRTALVAQLKGSVQLQVGKSLPSAAVPAVRLAKDVAQLKPFVGETLDVLERAFAHGKRVFVEGTQGTGLSLHHGFYPYVTSRETSVSGCLAEAGIAPTRVRRTIITVRSYPIRVESPKGATSGPMERELTWKTISDRSKIPLAELENAEKTTTTKKRRRVAEFDWLLLRKSVSLNGPTDIALTFADYLDIDNRKARRFEQLTRDTVQFIEEVERVAGAPVSLITTGFDHRSIIDRRAW